MIAVCKQHVNQGVKIIFLPHVQPIPEDLKNMGTMKCHLCGEKADFKLYNFESQRKSLMKKAI